MIHMPQYTLHGVTIDDPYQWLEDLDSPQTREWVAQQNHRTAAFFDTVLEREAIRKRLTELWNYEKCGVPVKEGGRYFFTRNDGLQNQNVLYTMDRLDDPPRVLIDPNKFSADGTVALTTIRPSHDGRLVAYGIAGSGSDWEEWRVLDVASAAPLSDHLKWIKFSTVTWTADNKGFFYCRYDEPSKDSELQGANYFQKLCYHRLGASQSADELVYFRPDQKEWVYEAIVSDGGRYLIIHVWKATGINDNIFYRDLQTNGSIVELIANFEARYHFIGNDGPMFWFQTDRHAPRGRVIAIDTRKPQPEAWREIIPERSQTLEATSIAGDRFIARYLRDAQAHIEIFSLEGESLRVLELPGIGSVTGFEGRREDAETFFDFTSFTTPARVYRYDVETGEMTLFHQPEPSFNPADYLTRQVFYASKDGTRIPMFISHKLGLKLDGENPTELYGYGGFNISLTPLYSPARLAWMEMGGVYAAPNLRGGGEYGEDWHQA